MEVFQIVSAQIACDARTRTACRSNVRSSFLRPSTNCSPPRLLPTLNPNAAPPLRVPGKSNWESQLLWSSRPSLPHCVAVVETMASIIQSNQIFLSIITKGTPEENVVYFKTLRQPTSLAAPTSRCNTRFRSAAYDSGSSRNRGRLCRIPSEEFSSSLSKLFNLRGHSIRKFATVVDSSKRLMNRRGQLNALPQLRGALPRKR